MDTIRVDLQGPVCRVTLSRADVRNAFDEPLIAELTRVFTHLDPRVRVAVLAGEGAVFCAGADLAWMQRSIAATEAENADDARRLSRLFQAVDEAPCVVIGRVHGAALGGGAGLAACCDVVVAQRGTRFGFPEVRLGLVPAVISPFVIRRTGPARARRYFLTGEVFDADEARRIGLADEVVEAASVDAAVGALTESILRAGPRAVEAAKKLVRVVEESEGARVHETVALAIAALRVQPEAQEGMRAFLEKRAPEWD